MILAFKPQFKQPILDGTKLHTIRQDAGNRWHAGRAIQMATGVRTAKYDQFNKHRKDLQQCLSTQSISITYKTFHEIVGPSVMVDGHYLTALQLHELAINDGFDNIDKFFEWFSSDFEGVIIHWTPKRY